MIQYYLDLENQVKAIKEKHLTGSQIQKIYSTAYYISMAIRTPGKTWHLYLGRGGGFEGLWLHESAPPSELRKKDTFLEYLRRHISSCGFVGIAVDEADRICKLDYQKFGQLQSMLFFWKARKLYFVHHYQEHPEGPFKLLLSWRGKAFTPPEIISDLFGFFDEVGRRTDMKHDLKSPNPTEMTDLLQEELKAGALKGMTSNPTFLQRKKENIESDLLKAGQWQRLQSMLDKGDSLDGYELKVGDHKIKFEGELNPYERRNIVFQKIKKLRRGEGILSDRLKGVEELLDGKETKTALESTLPIIKPVWGKEERPAIEQTRDVKNDFRIIKTERFQIGIGENSQGNDQLRSKWASKEDTWFHLDGHKSAHVVLKLPDQAALDTETINMAASILAYFSHFNGDWIPIIYTHVKNLKGVTGAAGMVIYKKEKHISCPRVDISQWLKE
ncbi:MAG TPA: NFACT RNA binding domain-containing protein [Bacteriovoracaceae bacterium]|nr:NFACT RNA binding domain-containing protein [Bacteriovoracaceae bacterium]